MFLSRSIQIFSELLSVAKQEGGGDGDDVGQSLLERNHLRLASPGLGQLHTRAQWDEVWGSEFQQNQSSSLS